MKHEDRPYFAALVFSMILTMLVGLFVGSTWLSARPPEQVRQALIRGSWIQGELPVGMPVIGVWKHAGEIVTMACIRTDFAGLYEYTMVGRAVQPLPDPDYWSPMPGVNP